MAASIAYQTAATQGGGGPYTFSVTVASAAGQERLVALCGVANGSASTVTFSGVAVDGQTATQVGSYARSPSLPVMSFWRAAGTSGTNIDVTATASGAMFDLRCAVWTLNDAGTLLDSASIGLTTGTLAQSLDLDTAADGVAVAASLGQDGGTVSSVWTGLTERFDGFALYGTETFSGADAATASASTPLAVTITFAYGGSFHVAAISLSFNPAPTGTLAADSGSYTLTGSTATGKFVLTAGPAGA